MCSIEIDAGTQQYFEGQDVLDRNGPAAWLALGPPYTFSLVLRRARRTVSLAAPSLTSYAEQGRLQSWRHISRDAELRRKKAA